MHYCQRCIQPDTRPGIFFSEDNICGACLWEDEKKEINWAEREAELQNIAQWARNCHAPYDCAIGVSGGKDSTFQAIYARDHLGLRSLLVNAEPEGITEIGRYNIENLKQLGFDVISLRPDPQIARKLIRQDFFDNLNPIIALEHCLWASTYLVADRFDIPLIIQGENAGQTLGVSKHVGTGGDAFSVVKLDTLKTDPLKAYAKNGIPSEKLFMYHFDLQKLIKKGTQAVWLSYYAKEWSQPHNAAFAIARGMKIRPKESDPYQLGTYRLFSQLDGSLLEVNQLLKYIKFGFGQATDHACYDIRDGFISREEGVFLARELDGRCGQKFLAPFLALLEISENDFWNHANKFRGPMWKPHDDGKWQLDNPVWTQAPPPNGLSVQSIMQRLGI